MLPVGPHNLILQISHSIGIIGLFAYLWLLITFFIKVSKLLKQVNILKDDKNRFRIISVLTAVTGFLIVTQFSFHSIASNVYFWTFIGIGMVMNPYKNIENISFKKRNWEFSKRIIYVIYLLLLILYILGMIIIVKPLVANYFFKKALICAEDKRYEDAEFFLQKSIRLHFNQSLYHETLGKVYGNMIRDVRGISKKKLFFNKALKEINLALSLNPLNVSYYWTKGNIYHIYYEETFDKSALDKSIKAYKKVIELDPYDPSIYYQLAIIYYVEKDMLEEALKALKYSIKLNPYKDIGALGKEIIDKNEQIR